MSPCPTSPKPTTNSPSAATASRRAAPRSTTRSRASAARLFARERLRALFDDDLDLEDGFWANALDEGLPADGVVDRRSGAFTGAASPMMANDSTVKAGSWGWRTVEKIIRIQETAERLRIPLVYLVDSAGARITDQLEMFPGRRGAGRIFRNQVRLSGFVPQICLLFGPSAAGGAYIPAFCDVVVMVEGGASMYLGSPRMAKMVIGEDVTLEEMGGAKMHCAVSGCGDVLAKSEDDALSWCRDYLAYMPQSCHHDVELTETRAPEEQKKTLGRADPGRAEQVVRHAQGDPPPRRRLGVPRDQKGLRQGAASPASRASAVGRSGSSRTSRST